jgi:hypothetical protein
MENERFQEAIRRIDAANAEDPEREAADGAEHPKELLYARRMSRWLERLAPGASEPLRLAVRAQHICRWKIPRASFPMDRAGYREWRSTLARMHAEIAGGILREVGYGEETVRRVQSLLQKEELKKDPETQTLEDAACLVFLEHYFAQFARRHDEAKLLSILRKTWKKMSPAGQQAALALELPPEARALVEKALAPPAAKGRREEPAGGEGA